MTRPIMWYGLCEIGVGLFAIVIPWETEWFWRLATPFYGSLREFQLVYSLVRCVVTFVVIGPACIPRHDHAAATAEPSRTQQHLSRLKRPCPSNPNADAAGLVGSYAACQVDGGANRGE